MKKLSVESFTRVRRWVYRNARQIELAVWRREFENGSGEDILSALAQYQNADGGFGNALEPDCWNPASSPYTTLNAADKLLSAGPAAAEPAMTRGILNFLNSGAHRTENGWLFSIPGNDGYARAPWWNYDEAANETEHAGVTLGLSCFVFRRAEKNSELYKLAAGFVEKLLAKLNEPGDKGDMGLNGYRGLLETVNELKLNERFDVSRLSADIKNLIDAAIERDVSNWAGYSVRPSQFIDSPDSPYYKGNEEITGKELDYLIDTLPGDDVWGITWQWWENYEKYPKQFAVAENWWKSGIATGNLKFLKSFGRVE